MIHSNYFITFVNGIVIVVDYWKAVLPGGNNAEVSFDESDTLLGVLVSVFLLDADERLRMRSKKKCI